ncbi:MAG: hypothetical protein KGI19_11175, partial [Thaumarchaeota archaeon]|nr:hypothetical protein [Nitrososphaerota archaeon]
MNRDQEKAMFANLGKRGKGLSKSSLSSTTKSTIQNVSGRRLKENAIHIEMDERNYLWDNGGFE